MYSKILSGAIKGINAIPVDVEVDISNGLPSFTMVGSLGNEVKESKDRVCAALKNSGISIPLSKITVNLSPADLHKEGNYYDLPIAIGILTSANYFNGKDISKTLFIGELGLDGEIKPVKGILPIVTEAKKQGISECIIPINNINEGSIVPGIIVRGATNLCQVIKYLTTQDEQILPSNNASAEKILRNAQTSCNLDFSQINGQNNAIRAATISAAGFHSLLLSGPPGVGKSMIAKRIPTIMPPLTLDESLELTAIHSIAGTLPPNLALLTDRIFQAPHHSITMPALIGGGGNPTPGAVTLAHRSVLFLDEFTEFDRKIINSLREPLESHMVSISRAKYSVTYPADFLLICAMNPCPCGYYPDRNKCKCTEPEIRRYLGKVSGPIMDRIDLFATLKNLDISEINSTNKNISSHELREQINTARNIQSERYKNTSYRFNSDLTGKDLDEYCILNKAEKAYMEDIYKKLNLSARSYHRIIRVARTIADLDESTIISRKHLLEAVCFRPDQSYFLN